MESSNNNNSFALQQTNYQKMQQQKYQNKHLQDFIKKLHSFDVRLEQFKKTFYDNFCKPIYFEEISALQKNLQTLLDEATSLSQIEILDSEMYQSALHNCQQYLQALRQHKLLIKESYQTYVIPLIDQFYNLKCRLEKYAAQNKIHPSVIPPDFLHPQAAIENSSFTLADFSPEILMMVNAYLSNTDVLRMRQVCSFFKANLHQDFLKLIEKKFVKQIACGDQFAFYVCADGSLYFCGISSDVLNNRPTFVPHLPPVKMIAVGVDHALVLCEAGSLWECKISVEEINNSLVMTPVFTPIVIPEDLSIEGVYAGFSNSFIISGDGSAWGFGVNHRGELGLSKLSLDPLPLTQLANFPPLKMIASSGYCSNPMVYNTHTAFVCEDGTVLVCGANFRGALGLQHTLGKELLVPQPILNLPEVEMVAVSPHHSIFLGKDGSVWACGAPENLALGFKNTKKNYFVPTQIPNLPPIKSIACQNEVTFFLCKDGSVMVCGANIRDQRLSDDKKKQGNRLGLGNKFYQVTPKRIPNLPPVKAIAAGKFHTVFLCEDNTVWSCGINLGQLGVVDDSNKKVPTPVPQFNQWVDFYNRLCQSTHATEKEMHHWKRSSQCTIV